MNGKYYFIRRKKQRKKKVIEACLEADSSSIADIAFLLLIFFIVTSSFLLPQGLFLKLPSKSGKPVQVKKKYIIDVYPKEEGYLIDKKDYNESTFFDLLKNRREQTPEIVLVVHTDRKVTYRRFVDTLNLAKKAKLSRISLREDK